MKNKTELYKRHRPSVLKDLVGNEHTINSLEKMATNNAIPHTILFSGPSGCGKTTMARILANMLGATESDVHELNMSHQDLRGIAGANEITSTMGFKSLAGNNRVFILDEVDAMTPDAQRLMKKPLEDTPEHIYFFLCTTRPEKLIRDIITRSTHIEVEKIDRRKLAGYVRDIAEKENVKINNSISLAIAEKAEGSVRKALVFLEQVLSVDSEEEQAELIKKISLEDNVDTIELCRALLNKRSWNEVSLILKKITDEPESVRHLVLAYFTKVLLNGYSPRSAEIIMRFSEPFYNSGRAGLVCSCFELCV